MKKIILTLAIAISTFSAFANEEKVNSKVLAAFKNEFSSAKEVEWTIANTYYMATFTYNNKYIYAYYTLEGSLIGMSHYITTTELPFGLQNNLSKQYSDYWVSDLFETTKNGETVYYITVENADKKIVLQSSGNDWEEFRKVRKV